MSVGAEVDGGEEGGDRVGVRRKYRGAREHSWCGKKDMT